MSLGRSGPGRPEPVSRNAPHPLRWRFSRVGADRFPVGRSRGFDASRLAPVRGCGCRSRAALGATPERCPAHHGPARARFSQWAGHERATPAAVRAVRRGVSVSDFTRAKPDSPESRRLPQGQSDGRKRQGKGIVVAAACPSCNVCRGHQTNATTLTSRPSARILAYLSPTARRR